MRQFHQPVLLQSVCTLLDIKPGRKYLDATLGGGGHSREILKRGGLVLGIDQDPDAITLNNSEILSEKANFIYIEEVAKKHNWIPIWGVLFDLGVSSHQLSTPQRGFSFQNPGPLDMRMDPLLPNTAATLVNTLPLPYLTKILAELGQERDALRIAKKIISIRPIASTDQLSELLPHPSQKRRVFQALRIAVNDELNAIKIALPAAFKLLTTGGVLAVISFHSLEDQIVKSIFKSLTNSGLGFDLTKNPIIPDQDEIKTNPKSKSAKLRAIKKI